MVAVAVFDAWSWLLGFHCRYADLSLLMHPVSACNGCHLLLLHLGVLTSL